MIGWFNERENPSYFTEGRSVIQRVTDLSNLSSTSGPYEICLSTNDIEYIIMPLSRLHGQFKIVKENGGDMENADDNKVAVINYLSNTMFNKINVYLENVQVEHNSCSGYHYKALFEAMFSYDKNVKKTWLKSGLYLDDDEVTTTANEADITETEDGDGNVLFKRAKWTNRSEVVSFSSLLHADLFGCPQLIPPSQKVKINFFRNSDDVTLMGQGGFKIKLIDLFIEYRKVEILPSIMNDQKSRFSDGEKLNLTYDMTDVKSWSIPAGLSGHSLTLLTAGSVLPSQIILGFVHDRAFSGSRQHDPFAFRSFGIQSIKLKRDGIPYPAQEFEPKWGNANKEYPECSREYMNFQMNVGIQHGGESNGLSFKQYRNNKNLWAWDFSPDLCNGFQPHQPRVGKLDLDIKWSPALRDALQLICFIVYGNTGLVWSKTYGVAKVQDLQQLNN